jgi:hypothetical protein
MNKVCDAARIDEVAFCVAIAIVLVTLEAAAGAATGPVTLSPSSLSFGNQFINTTCAPQNVVLTNNQSVAVNFSSIQVFGSYQQTNTCGSSIRAESSGTVTAAFQPTASGAASGAVELTDNASNSPQSINLSGSGTPRGFDIDVSLQQQPLRREYQRDDPYAGQR